MTHGDGLPDLDTTRPTMRRLPFGRGAGLAVAQDDPLASRPWVGVAELAEVAWIVGGGTAHAHEFEAWPSLQAPRVVHSVRSWLTR